MCMEIHPEAGGMEARKKQILSMEPFPKDDKNPNVIQRQVEWLLTLETTFRDMQLTEKDKEMESETYNCSVIRPTHLQLVCWFVSVRS